MGETEFALENADPDRLDAFQGIRGDCCSRDRYVRLLNAQQMRARC
jgi:hypothetical protein